MRKLQTEFFEKKSVSTEEEYMRMLEVLPPRIMASNGFLVGEPWDHQGEGGAARYQFYYQENGGYYYAGLATVSDFTVWLLPVEDKPIPYRQYALTGSKDSKCIMNGNSWAESEVK